MYLVALLTQSNGPLRPLAVLLGWLMNWIYVGIGNMFNVHNVALTIFIFTIVIYLFMLPLTYQQQKFSKMTMIMNPELKKIQKKYQGKRDQDSINKMNEETRAIYKKYGVSPSGSCIYLVIQLPILFALYRVIYNVPAYISSIKGQFTDLVNGIMATSGYQKTMTSFFDTIKNHNYVYRGVSLNFDTAATTKNSLIDVLYKCTNANWSLLKENFPDLSQIITTTQHHLNIVNDFLGVNVVYAPRVVIANGFRTGAGLMILIGILIPVVSALTQLINIRLMPQPSADMSGGAGIRFMNYLMPVYSFILVFFLPVGVGIYWIAGALIRSLQQWFFNRRLDRIDVEALIKKNQEKAKVKEKKKIEKQGVKGTEIKKNASISTKNINSERRNTSMAAKANSVRGKASSADYNTGRTSGNEQHYRKNSLAAKANLVNEYNNGTLKELDSRKDKNKSGNSSDSSRKKNSGNSGKKTSGNKNSGKSDTNKTGCNQKNSVKGSQKNGKK